MIIDSHAHLVAPDSLYKYRTDLVAFRGQFGYFKANISDEALGKAAAHNVALMDEVGTDVQILSPRPFILLHGTNRWNEIRAWTETNNDLIARTVQMHPTRFRGVGALPQSLGRPVETVFDEITRCIEELGFVGVLLNPDPSEGTGESPPLGDPYWYPLYERLCELDLPAHIHSGACTKRETYDEHFISEESLAITSIVRGGVFKRFPELKLMVSHGGGAIPYQMGRWQSNTQMQIAAGFLPQDHEAFDVTLRRFWFDTLVHHKPSLELLLSVVGTDRCCFGTERPGSGGGINPLTGLAYDDLKPVIESIESLTKSDLHALFEGNARRLFGRLGL
ncbi:MAG: 4-oxalmesaconate hydratase [Rhodothermales bacterium]|jgi:4-oxalmesaconate hydratase